MRITNNYHEFFGVTGMIHSPFRLKELGLTIEGISSSFWPDDMDDVLDFCAQNPGFHIVSYLDEGIFINRYDESAGLFMLADGDNDPEYMLDTKHLYRWIMPAKNRAS